jgi:phosphatidylglycerophosphatase A
MVTAPMEGASSSPRVPLPAFHRMIATGLGSGYAPVAPGTAGSAVGLLLFWPLSLAPSPLQLAVTVLAAGLGVLSAGRLAAHLGVKDPGRATVDEVVGMWVSLLFLPFSVLTAALAFVAFRAMDVLKPYPARDLEALPGGWGIMADDLMAGVYANLLVRIALSIWPMG